MDLATGLYNSTTKDSNVNQLDRARFSATATKAREYVECVHDEAKNRYFTHGEDYLSEWLEYTIQETGELLDDLQFMIDKCNRQNIDLLINNDVVMNLKVVQLFK